MAPNPTADLKTLIDQLRDGTYPGLDIRDDLEKILAEMAANPTADLKEVIEAVTNGGYDDHGALAEKLTEILAEVVGPTELYHVVKNMDNRLAAIEEMVASIAKEVGPIVAELAESPIIKMMTGGKKRV